MMRAVFDGLSTMFRHRRLALILWAWTLVIGLAGAAPAMRWFNTAWPARPGADVLLQGFDFPTYMELSQYDASPTWAIVMAAVLAAGALAFVGGAFVTAGVLHVLLDHDINDRTRTLWSRFARGGGQAFWRSLGVSIIHGIVVLIAVASLAGGLSKGLESLSESPAEWAGWTSMILRAALIGIVVAVLSAVADYARLRVVADPVCGAIRAWFGALSFTLRHPMTTTLIWIAFAVMTGVVLAVSFAWSISAPTTSMGWIVALILVQQGVMLARAMVRVATLGAEVSYAGRKGFALPELPGAIIEALPVETIAPQVPAAGSDVPDDHDAPPPPPPTA